MSFNPIKGMPAVEEQRGPRKANVRTNVRQDEDGMVRVYVETFFNMMAIASFSEDVSAIFNELAPLSASEAVALSKRSAALREPDVGPADNPLNKTKKGEMRKRRRHGSRNRTTQHTDEQCVHAGFIELGEDELAAWNAAREEQLRRAKNRKAKRNFVKRGGKR